MIVKNSVIKKDLHKVIAKWQGKMLFDVLADNHTIHLDKMPAHGGDDKGPRPKPLILSAIGGCTGMEIISITDKMRLKMESLEIDIEGELSEAQPKVYQKIHLNIKVKCNPADEEKIKRAIALAVDKYCGAVAMARHFAKVTYSMLGSD